MNPSLRSANLARSLCLLVIVGSLWSASHGFAAPAKAPAPTPALNSDDEDEAPDPAKIVLPGTVIERPGGKGYLSLTLSGGSLKLSFYDKNKQPVAVDVARAVAHWSPKQQHGEENAVLNPSSDGQSLVGNRFVQPPFPLQIFITLLSEQGVGVENHTVMFKP